MNKREKAAALAARHEMVEKNITTNQILLYATTAEVHGYWKGVFRPSPFRGPANLYALAVKIKERKEAGLIMNRRPKKGVYSAPAPRRAMTMSSPAVRSSGFQLALAF